MIRQVILSALMRRVLLCVVFLCALTHTVEAADGYYNGLKLPYMAGQARIVVRSTGHGAGRHAVDFGMYYEDVLAMYAGRVVAAADGGALGRFVVIDHGDNYCALYLHLDKWYVKAGQRVQQGERIALSGNTGKSSGPHLHVAVYRKTNGACGAAGAAHEVMLLFDEKPSRELVSGDWIVSRNGKPFTPYYPSLANVTSHSISVKWNDYSNNEQGFKVERRIGRGAWSEVATIGENAISYVNNGLSAATPYCYRVRAYNRAGNSTYSNVVCATTRPADPNQPAAAAAPNTPASNETSNGAESPADDESQPDATNNNGEAALYNAMLSVRLFLEHLGGVSPGDDGGE